MNITKTLLLAGFAALSLGAGAAMAQESPGGYLAGPYDQSTAGAVQTAPAFRYGPSAMNVGQSPQYGSADHSVSNPSPVLEGSDGS